MDIRDRLGLLPGMQLEIEAKENEVVLKPVGKESSLKLKKGILVYSGKATRDLTGTVWALCEERLRKSASGKQT
jgi:bifunctional DNA-binding transcriptional regulator/antitoxin component of YhaV-PrlF toxin-antitoxin module